MGNTDSGSWIRVYRQAPEGIRLFCFPHAGGAATSFFSWGAALPGDVEVLALQYPGRQDRGAEAHLRSVPELADRIHEAVRPLLDAPYAFFGHSMGAILSFEVARRIAREDGPAPAHLFVSGRRAPSLVKHEELHRASRADFVAEMGRLGGTDPRILADEELLDLVLPTVRADYEAIETYRYEPGPPLSCAITGLTGDRDPRASVDEVAAWTQHTLGRFDLRIFPGGHFYLEDCRAGVLDVISSVLSGVRQDGTSLLP
ncbi:thioesterase II family protein [Kitasatospora sp. NPDC059463]|uniref:thioesterase II family protein n=1 Tax=unclassified Kitasatospora TaxID=2633591 RepID=UPI0036B4ACEF